MTPEEAKRVLEAAGFVIKETRRLKNNSGDQLCLSTGQFVSVYDKGTWNVQGKDAAAIEAALGGSQAPAVTAASPSGDSRKVFVVYGHDGAAKTQLEAMLRRWRVEPLFLDQLPSEGQTVIEKLEAYAKGVEFAIVLATPDDEGHRTGHSDERAFRARQNVVLELGMMLAHLGRKRVAILLKEQDKMERPSDIQGLIYIPFKDDVQDAKVPLAKEMAAQGFSIDLQRL
jgi:predicted nucleotide-binding protein